MPQVNLLHWSFNHDNRQQTPFFAEQILTALRHLPPVQDGDTIYYDILPNFWRGFKGRSAETDDGFDLRIGEIMVTRQQSETWRYTIRSSNTTSGENQHLTFECANKPYRPLTGTWLIAVKNSAGDGYQRFDCQGKITHHLDALQITLTVNDVALDVGLVNNAVPLTCNWALFDIIPARCNQLKQTGETVVMTILEDLEKIRRHVQLGFLENWRCIVDETSGQTMHLDGFFLYGEGLVPSYWWLDQHNRVVIVSSIFQTWVLRGLHD